MLTLLMLLLMLLLVLRLISQAVDYPCVSCPWVGGRTLLAGSHVSNAGLVPQVTNFGTVAKFAMSLKL
jgi:hypothetical protein